MNTDLESIVRKMLWRVYSPLKYVDAPVETTLFPWTGTKRYTANIEHLVNDKTTLKVTISLKDFPPCSKDTIVWTESLDYPALILNRDFKISTKEAFDCDVFVITKLIRDTIGKFGG